MTREDEREEVDGGWETDAGGSTSAQPPWRRRLQRWAPFAGAGAGIFVLGVIVGAALFGGDAPATKGPPARVDSQSAARPDCPTPPAEAAPEAAQAAPATTTTPPAAAAPKGAPSRKKATASHPMQGGRTGTGPGVDEGGHF